MPPSLHPRGRHSVPNSLPTSLIVSPWGRERLLHYLATELPDGCPDNQAQRGLHDCSQAACWIFAGGWYNKHNLLARLSRLKYRRESWSECSAFVVDSESGCFSPSESVTTTTMQSCSGRASPFISIARDEHAHNRVLL